MKIELNNLNELKNGNPFKVPDGYMENLTSQIMDQLPEKPVTEAKQITLMDRMRPWMYMAAMFAGLGLFFRFFVGSPAENHGDNALFVESGNAHQIAYEIQEAEDDDFFEFIENQYAGVLLAEEWKYID
ncbi:MAG: hypothetical protein LUG98_08730 [Tannerellaceae bacterium]|nr:hypothetical protein [Tannerellaceae bacterium]